MPTSRLLVVVAALALAATACNTGSGRRSRAAAAPTLAALHPAAGEVLGPTDPLVAVFDVALLATSVAPSVAAVESVAAPSAKAGSVSQPAPEAALFAPQAPWALDATVTLEVATTLRSARDLPLAAPVVATRSTAPTTARVAMTQTGSNPGVVGLADGRLLVAGGNQGGAAGALRTTTVVDPRAGAAVPSGDLVEPRFGHVAVLLAGGQVAVVGGQTAAALHTTVEVWDPATGAWTVRLTGVAPRTSLHAVLPLTDGRWLVVGGYANTGQTQPQPVIEVLTADMSAVSASAQVASLGGQAALLPAGDVVLLFGRVAAGPTTDAEVLRLDAAQPDPVVSVTRLQGVLVTPAGATSDWNHPSAAALPDGRVLVQQADATCVVTLTSQAPPATTAIPGPVLQGRGRTFTRLVPAPDGSLLIGPGGRSPGASGTDPVADLYRPGPAGGAGELTPLTPRTGRRSSGVAALRDGRIVVVGGREGGLSGPLLGGQDAVEVFSLEALAQASIGLDRRTIAIGVAPAAGWPIGPSDRTFIFVTSGALDPTTAALAQAVTATVNGQAAGATATLVGPRRLEVTLSAPAAAGDRVEVVLGPALRDLEGRPLDLTRGVTSAAWRVR
ncbi:MAG: hypothetical protein M9894_03410 [Planctomycetes bacterium]|nr:hypothetical protein [Planctomycetota bacterium]